MEIYSKILIVIAIFVLLTVLLLLRKTWADDNEPDHKLAVSFYYKDKLDKSYPLTRRKFKGPVHFLHNSFELMKYTGTLLGVYTVRTVSPEFREKIMLTTTFANDCYV